MYKRQTLSSPTVLSVSYYDSYDFLGKNGIPDDATTAYSLSLIHICGSELVSVVENSYSAKKIENQQIQILVPERHIVTGLSLIHI